MISALSVILIVLSLLLAGWVLVYVVRDRLMDNALLGGLLLLEAGLLIQLVLGLILAFTTDRDVNLLSFLGYLVGVLVILPVAVLWSAGEKSRAGTTVLLVATLVIPVLVLRLGVIWGE